MYPAFVQVYVQIKDGWTPATAFQPASDPGSGLLLFVHFLVF